MILLVTPSVRAEECAAILGERFGERVQVARSLRVAITRASKLAPATVVVDQLLLDSEPALGEALFDAAGSALLVTVNLALSSVERVATEVRKGLERAERERLAAWRAAQTELRGQLAEPVTGILLSSDLLLQHHGLPPAVQAEIRNMREFALQMRLSLEPGALLRKAS